jgi:hypothetical protein
MTLTVLPKPGDRYAHRLVEHQPDNPDYCTVEVIAVTPCGERTVLTVKYMGHKPGRRDFFAVTVPEFASTYRERITDG